jgi:hypothetical protein
MKQHKGEIMTRTMIGIKILELTTNGLQEIFEVECEPIDTSDEVRQAEAFEKITAMFFNQDSVYMTTDCGSVIVRGLATKTIVLRAVFARAS